LRFSRLGRAIWTSPLTCSPSSVRRPTSLPDVQLAALAIEHGAEMYSNDTDYGRFPDLQWVNPLR
jgi:predicted nucleic acid-binding protein